AGLGGAAAPRGGRRGRVRGPRAPGPTGGAAADPATPLSALPLITDDEFTEVVHVWNDTAREVPAGTFPELFAARVAERPEATAVIDESGPVSYRELDERANRIAH
ncbi:hypothetical protein ADL27_50895, partial [Streptomyces sp. NRRL F-6602]